MVLDKGEELAEKSIVFDTFIRVIDGEADLVINGASNLLHTSQAIIVPAHARSYIKANKRFKMIVIVIKSGYDL